MTDDEFSSWFTHDGGPCPIPVGTVHIRELQKAKPGGSVNLIGDICLVSDDYQVFSVLGRVPEGVCTGPNSWEWKYFGTVRPGTGGLICKVLRYRVKKSPGVKLLEQIAKDPPIDLIPDPERKLLEYHPT